MLRGWTSKWNLCLPSFTMLYPVFLCIYGVWCIFFCHDCCCIFNSLLPYVPLLSLSSKLWEELLPNDQANGVWYRRSRFMMVLSRISWWIDEVMKEQAKQFFDEGTWQQQLACHTLLPFYHLFRRSISVIPLLSSKSRKTYCLSATDPSPYENLQLFPSSWATLSPEGPRLHRTWGGMLFQCKLDNIVPHQITKQRS